MIGWCVLLVGLACLPTARADERMREVQEELRRRHLYYGEINGQFTPELSAALKHFQARKGFPESGRVDDETLQSLGIASSAAPPSEGPNYPDVPVLKSDAPAHPDKRAPTSPPEIEPVAFKTPPTRQEVGKFLHDYFAACQTTGSEDELRFYGDHVRYFDHGTVGRSYIQNELAVYDQHWPQRAYVPSAAFQTSRKGNAVSVRCRVAFDVENARLQRQARGQTSNSFVIQRGPDAHLYIEEIHETRVRRTRRASRSSSNRQMATTWRHFGNAFRSLFR